MRCVVLYGGNSPEREVSLRSGQAVADALIQSGFEVVLIDINDDFSCLDQIRQSDIVLPILHGINGEDGVIQHELEKRKLNYLGAKELPSRRAFNKATTHKLLEKQGILMPQYEVVSADTVNSSSIIKGSFVIKPIEGGSSIDTAIVDNYHAESAKKLVGKLLQKHNEMLIEECIKGVEITVPILDDTVLPVIAIVPPKGQEFDYENKYNGLTAEICPIPYDLLTQELQDKAGQIALLTHRALGLRHLSRTDMIVSTDSKIYVLETNTMPGMTTESLYPKSALVSGLNMKELTSRFISMVAKNKL